MSLIISFALYAAVMMGVGAACFKKNDSASQYFLDGRNLGSWVAAMSAQASDMSGWLLMGLPGAIYAMGTGRIWIAAGLALGTAANWLIVAKRLRRYTIAAGDSITIPAYLENRFRDSSGTLRTVSAVVIAVFFTVYAASAFVAGGTLFSTVFGTGYVFSLTVSAALILGYTFMGGFSAVCVTDFLQGMLMLLAILSVPIIALCVMGGVDPAALPEGFLSPVAGGGGAVSIISQLAWGLGYFGMPHILTRFMAIRDEKSVSKSARIAIVWVVFSLGFAIAVGVAGRAFVPGLSDPETVFIAMIDKIFMNWPAIIPAPILGGFFLCGILAAIMSTADSQLLVTASSLAYDIYRPLVRKDCDDRRLMLVSRGAVLVVSAAAFLIALGRNSSIMSLVSDAWAGFGSAFGAVILLSLYNKRVNGRGAIAGIISGGGTVIIWDYLTGLGRVTGLYSLIPGFAVSLAATLAVSFATAPPPSEVCEEFERVEKGGAEFE
ncbi:MAG: sodium/proline symporter PutP [Clostridiales bacterium]|jgi:sodium/proline symporter|nr:sodium/proline symporter PutP [Clostridiales bacterium]